MTSEAAGRIWDVIVIGAGMGGGIAGRRLAEAGLSVLFVEKGPDGPRSERQGIHADIADPVARLVRGWWPDPVRATIDGRSEDLFAPIGAGVGGSSVFYAATLERPERHDLDDLPDRPHPAGGWPVGYDAYRPWFDAAADMLHICGAPDPLSSEAAARLHTPPPLPRGDAALMARLRAGGLHPYRLHSAIRYLDGCLDCLGTKCPRPCKMDGRSAGIEPALATGRAALLDMCDVQALRGTADGISHIDVRRGGAALTLRARTYVLAAGALGSPRLLLASAAEHWPQGCANASGLVGRHLMFHLNEMFALWPGRAAQFAGPSKAIALRDLYHVQGQRFGMVQAMGVDASYGEILHYLRRMLAASPLARIGALHHGARLPAALAARLLGNAKVFVGLLEDLGYPENRVRLDPDAPGRLMFDYTLSDELLARRHAFRRAIARAFRGQRRMFLTRRPELNLGHPSGTLRFGRDPARSVLDADCRAHGLRNLYVADASFMPSSMGVNPSLTIAANALRVAEAIIERTRTGGQGDAA